MALLDLVLTKNIPALLAYEVPYRQTAKAPEFVDEWVGQWGNERCLDWFVARHPNNAQLVDTSRALVNINLPRGLGFLSFLHRPARNTSIARRHLNSAMRDVGGLGNWIFESMQAHFLERCLDVVRSNQSRTREFTYMMNRLFLHSLTDGTGQHYIKLDAVQNIFEAQRMVQFFDPDNGQFLQWHAATGVPTTSTTTGASESGSYPASMLA